MQNTRKTIKSKRAQRNMFDSNKQKSLYINKYYAIREYTHCDREKRTKTVKTHWKFEVRINIDAATKSQKSQKIHTHQPIQQNLKKRENIVSVPHKSNATL